MKILPYLTAFVLFGTSLVAHADNLRHFGQTAHSYQSAVNYGNANGHYIQSQDAKIYYEIHGQGEPVVVLHGGLVGSIGEMGQLIDNLAKTHQVIAVSTRGHGKSEIGHQVPSYAVKAQDVYNVLTHITDKPAHILGFSDGAYTAYHFALNFPDKTAKIIAIGAGEWQKGFRTFGGTFADFTKLDPLYWQEQATIRPEPKRTEEWYGQNVAYFNELDIGESVFKNITAKTLLIVGEDDQNAPLPTVIKAYEALPNADIAVIPNASHSVFADNFNAVWAVVEPFLAK